MGMRQQQPWPLDRRRRLQEPEIYDVLQNERRRRALRCLRDRTGEVQLTELAETIACLECDQQPSPSEVRESVYNSLHQTHLPKLEGADIVDYDEDSKVVRLASNAPEIDRYLQLRTIYGFSWGEYYQLFATTSLIVVLLTELRVSVFGHFEPLLVVTVALATLALSVAYQVWTRRWLYLRTLFT